MRPGTGPGRAKSVACMDPDGDEGQAWRAAAGMLAPEVEVARHRRPDRGARRGRPRPTRHPRGAAEGIDRRGHRAVAGRDCPRRLRRGRRDEAPGPGGAAAPAVAARRLARCRGGQDPVALAGAGARRALGACRRRPRSAAAGRGAPGRCGATRRHAHHGPGRRHRAPRRPESPRCAGAERYAAGDVVHCGRRLVRAARGTAPPAGRGTGPRRNGGPPGPRGCGPSHRLRQRDLPDGTRRRGHRRLDHGVCRVPERGHRRRTGAYFCRREPALPRARPVARDAHLVGAPAGQLPTGCRSSAAIRRSAGSGTPQGTGGTASCSPASPASSSAS